MFNWPGPAQHSHGASDGTLSGAMTEDEAGSLALLLSLKPMYYSLACGISFLNQNSNHYPKEMKELLSYHVVYTVDSVIL